MREVALQDLQAHRHHGQQFLEQGLLRELNERKVAIQSRPASASLDNSGAATAWTGAAAPGRRRSADSPAADGPARRTCAPARTGRPGPRPDGTSPRWRRLPPGRRRQSAADAQGSPRTDKSPRRRRPAWAPGRIRAAARTRRTRPRPATLPVSLAALDFTQRCSSIAAAPCLSTSIERARPPVSSVASVNGTSLA